MHPVLLEIGPLSIFSYGCMVALAFLAGIFVSIYYAKKEGLKPEIILDLAIYVIVSAVLGARLFYVLGQWEYFRANPLEIIMLQKGGLVFLGGLLFSLLTVLIYTKKKSIPLLKLFDAITPGTVLGYTIGRIGCFLNGCCFGLPAKLPWAVIFPSGSLAAFHFPGEPLHPTQLYSSLSVLLIFIMLIGIYRVKKFDGQVFYGGLMLYSVYRFLIEFLRYSPIHWLALTPSQWLVFFTFAVGVWGLAHGRKRI